MTAQESMPGGVIDRRAIPHSAHEVFWVAPDGHPIRRIDWAHPESAPCRGSILFVPGRADFYEKYLDTLDLWHGRGWSVTAMDWRGQAGSGRLGQDDTTGHISDFGVWVDDLAQFWAQWVKDTPAPHVLIAHSMGGHIAMRALAEKRLKPDAVVMTAPMLGLLPDHIPRAVLHIAARSMAKVRGAEHAAWRGQERPVQLPLDRQNLLTHDKERYADELWWRQERPFLNLGAPTWGWIERAYSSMEEMDRPGMLEGIDVPLLILATNADRLVSWKAIHKAAGRIPGAELKVYGADVRHEIFRESDAQRQAALGEVDRFLDVHAPATGVTA